MRQRLSVFFIWFVPPFVIVIVELSNVNQVVVGGGPTGVELSGELHDFLEVRIISFSFTQSKSGF